VDIPTTDTRILVYCRNNLAEKSSIPATPTPTPSNLKKIEVIREFEYPTDYDPPEIPKSFGAGLNIPSVITLHSYGYTNVWELDDIVDPNDSLIKFQSAK